MTDADPTTILQGLRGSIDNIDAALIFLLAERFRCTKQVGVLKAQHGMPASDPSREEQQIARLKRLAAEADLDPEFAEIAAADRLDGYTSVHGLDIAPPTDDRPFVNNSCALAT